MGVKMTGAEFTAFMADKEFWWEGRWYDDASFSINGGPEFDWDGEEIAPADVVKLEGGSVYDHADIGSPHHSLESKVRAWQKARKVAVLVIEVAKEHLDAHREVISRLQGVKILK